MSPPADHPTPPPLSRRGFIAASGIAALVVSVGVTVLEGDVANAAWGGYSNGNIPPSTLAPVPWDTVRILRTDARDALVAMNGAFVANFGHNITINDGYRDFAEQVRAKQKFGSNAATPGTSNHGWAIAVDIARTNRVQLGFSDPIYLWLKSNAARYGWVHPAWAEPGGSRPEAWHWEYNGTYTGVTPPVTQTTPNDEDVMYYQAISASADGVIPNGWIFVNSADGPLRALSSLEGGAVSVLHPSQIAMWAGNDIRALVKIVGLRQQGAQQGVVSSVGPVINDGRLTGTIVY